MARPDLHAHQLHALAAGADAFALARAAWLDRLAGQARVLARLGETEWARAVLAEHAAASTAEDPSGWAHAIAGASARTAAVGARRRAAAEAFTRMLLCRLAEHGGAPDEEVDLWREQARAAAGALLEADPAFDPHAPPYAHRMPWPANDLLDGWLAAAAPEPSPPPLNEAGVEEALAAAGWPGREVDCHAADPGRGGEAEAIAAPLRAIAAEAIARRNLWPDPILERHWRALDADLSAAATATEAELVAFHAEVCLAVEGDWNVLARAAVTLPFRAACTHDPARAVATASALTGLAPGQLAALPSVAGILERIEAGGPDPRGAGRGEGGLELLAAARGAEVARPADRLADGGRETEPVAVAMRFWGEPVTVADPAAVPPRRPRL